MILSSPCDFANFLLIHYFFLIDFDFSIRFHEFPLHFAISYSLCKILIFLSVSHEDLRIISKKKRRKFSVSQSVSQLNWSELNYRPILYFFPAFFSKKARNQPFKIFLWLSGNFDCLTKTCTRSATSKRKSLKQPHFLN